MAAAQSIAHIDLWQIVQAQRQRILELERPKVVEQQPRPPKYGILLRPHERETLKTWVAQKSMSTARKQRARILLLADEGETNVAIAARLGVARNTVLHWRARFARRGLAGLEPLPKPGRPPARDRATRALRSAIETTAALVANHKQQASRADPHRKPRPRSANLAALAKLLPPGRPPCFDSDAIWQDFIQHAAASGRRQHADGPVIWLQGGAPALNRDFSYCEDCTAARQARMQGENRCLPNFLKDGQ